MRSTPRWTALCLLLALAAAICWPLRAWASAYDGHPKLVVVIVIDQFRGDYLDRYHDKFGDSGFRLLIDHGAYFPNCNYHYANTRTAPGHSTLFTGAYSNGHGIIANEWWDPKKKRMVTSVEDDDTKLVGVADAKTGASPHNLMADTIGDELKLATQGNSRVFSISLKDRAAILPGGFAANAAYWIEPKTGAWISSTYYRPDLPKWVQDFNASRPPKYWDREWKDSHGTVLGYERLKPTPTATTVRMKNGAAMTIDGPFAETKEQLAGYYILECKDLDEAIEWGKRIPTICRGGEGCIEIRPVADIPKRE